MTSTGCDTWVPWGSEGALLSSFMRLRASLSVASKSAEALAPCRAPGTLELLAPVEASWTFRPAPGRTAINKQTTSIGPGSEGTKTRHVRMYNQLQSTSTCTSGGIAHLWLHLRCFECSCSSEQQLRESAPVCAMSTVWPRCHLCAAGLTAAWRGRQEPADCCASPQTEGRAAGLPSYQLGA